MNNKFWDLIFPRKCVGCEKILSPSEQVFCRECESKWILSTERICKECGYMQYKCRCAPKDVKKGYIDTYRHLSSFHNATAKKFVYTLKHRKNSEAFSYAANALFSLICDEEGLDFENCVICYCPRSEKAIRKYGFDQAQILAKKLSKISKIPVVNALVHNGSHTEQKLLDAEQRKILSQTTYSLMPNVLPKIKGKTAILVDDIITTGSTSVACAKLLKIAGAKKVFSLSVAYTQKIYKGGC